MRIAEKMPNKQYNLAASNSLPMRIASHQRRVMYERFIIETGISEQDRMLDVGVTTDRSYESSNYLEAWYPHKSAITAVGIDDASLPAELYAGIRYLSANGLELPFSNLAFDIVHSSAVLEHVGSVENQIQLVLGEDYALVCPRVGAAGSISGRSCGRLRIHLAA
jgi:ubiquinone/menaquinone biosynthesis C-methylase UbiE